MLLSQKLSFGETVPSEWGENTKQWVLEMKTGQINLGNYKAPLELRSTKAYVLFF